MSKTISITLTDEEYAIAEKEAVKKGLTITQYVKRYPITVDDFDLHYKRLKQKALDSPKGNTFTVMSLFSDWSEIDLGTRLSLGRNFYHLVKKRELLPVIPAGKNSSNVQLYTIEENKMQELLGEKYTDNPIVNYLNYFMCGEDIRPTPKRLFDKEYKDLSDNQKDEYKTKYGEWRKKYDLDVIWLNGDLNADTIFSVWTPLKMCLQSSTKYPYSKSGSHGKPWKSKPYIPNIIKNLDKYLPYNEWKQLYEFIELAATKANVMRLENVDMQTRGIVEYDNGEKKVEQFYDQMPRMLYECFEGGEFQNKSKGRSYFNSDDDVKVWVDNQKLEMLFIDNEISRGKIKPLIKRMNPNEYEWLKDKNEINEMLENFINILKLRGKEY